MCTHTVSSLRLANDSAVSVVAKKMSQNQPILAVFIHQNPDYLSFSAL